MKETKCEAVRRELEELMLGDEFSNAATQHLRECGECRAFQQQQTKLRQIVGSLGTVEAPPDFDFRLRARLANESHAGGFLLRSLQWSFASKAVAAGAMVLLFAGGVVYVRTVVKQPAADPAVAQQQEEAVQPAPKPVEETALQSDPGPAVASDHGPRRVTAERRVAPSRAKPRLVAVDIASERAPVISSSQRQSPIFPIDASLQPLRVSLDDGEGNARTISVPTISFGSQRVLPKETRFVEKGVW